MVLKELAKAVGFQPAGPGKAPGGVAHVDVEYAPGGAAHGVAEGNPGGTPAHGCQWARLTTRSLEWPYGDAP